MGKVTPRQISAGLIFDRLEAGAFFTQSTLKTPRVHIQGVCYLSAAARPRTKKALNGLANFALKALVGFGQ